MKVYVVGVVLVVFLASFSVHCDERDDHEVNRRFFFPRQCRSNKECPKHQYCCQSWFKKYCRNLPTCFHKYNCPSGAQCKRKNIYHYIGQRARTSTCSTQRDCDQATECCRSNGYFHHCRKRPQEGQTCFRWGHSCYKCAEGLVCQCKNNSYYGRCQVVPTTIKPTTEGGSGEGSGDYNRRLL